MSEKEEQTHRLVQISNGLDSSTIIDNSTIHEECMTYRQTTVMPTQMQTLNCTTGLKNNFYLKAAFREICD
jgi:hypothetical protein